MGIAASIIYPDVKPMYNQKDFKEELRFASYTQNSGSLQVRPRKIPFLEKLHPYKPTRYFMIYFHGNAEDLYFANEFVKNIQERILVNGIIVEYPGYGVYRNYEKNNAIIEQDAEAVYEHIKKTYGAKDEEIIIFGRSLGSGPAFYLASLKPCHGLITMSAYTSINSVARDKVYKFLADMFVEKGIFPNFERAQHVQTKCLLIHGVDDDLIQSSHSEKLFHTSLPKKYLDQSKLELRKNMDHNNYNLEDDLLEPIASFFPHLDSERIFSTELQFQQSELLPNQMKERSENGGFIQSLKQTTQDQQFRTQGQMNRGQDQERDEQKYPQGQQNDKSGQADQQQMQKDSNSQYQKYSQA